MRKFKTPEKQRTNYYYYTVDGRQIILTPAEVGSTWIALLHAEDDADVDADRRAAYHTPCNLDQHLNTNIGHVIDPFERMIQVMNATEYAVKLKKLHIAIRGLQLQQRDLIQKVFYQKRTKVDVAKEEGVSEAAIRNRLKKIYSNLAKKI